MADLKETEARNMQAAAAPSDHSLLRRFRDGQQDAATQLYLRYAPRLRGLARAQMSDGLARRVELDDIVQSVFRSFFRRAGSGLYDVPAGAEFWRLLLVIALHKIRNQGAFHRAACRDVRRTVGEGELERASAPEEERAVLHLVIEEALGRLTPAQQQIIELRIEGYEVAEIARQIGRSKRTVERILQEARQRLKDLFKETDEE